MTSPLTHPTPPPPGDSRGRVRRSLGERDRTAPLPLRTLLLRAVTNAAVAGVVISLLVHAIGWIAASGLVIGMRGGTSAGGGDEGVGMAVVTAAELSELTELALGVQAPVVPDVEFQAPESAGVMDDAPGADEGGSIGEVTDVGPLAGGGDIGPGGGEGLGGSGGGGGASFFGVEVQGNRFAYVVDVSTSMETADRIGTLRKELAKSINGLLESSQFYMIRYSTDAAVMTDRKEWIDASATGKRIGRIAVETLLATGTTNPVPGFELALAVRPRPDAIYFMTDGEFPQENAELIAALARKAKVPVHCICLGNQDGEKVMRMISKSTRGTFTFVPDRGGMP